MATKLFKMKYQLIFSVLLALGISTLSAQNSNYFEYADHQSVTANYIDVLARNSSSAYVFQDAAIYLIEGKNRKDIYPNNWGSASFSVFPSPEDTVIYVYDYFDYDIGTNLVSKITIQNDSVSIINNINDNFDGLNLSIRDIVIDSLDQTLVFHHDGVHVLLEKLDTSHVEPKRILDTIYVSDLQLPFFSKLCQNSELDIFSMKGSEITPIKNDFTLGQTIQLEEDIKDLLLFEEKFYVLHEQSIAVYDEHWQNKLNDIAIDLQHGEIKGFTIDQLGQIIVLQNTNSTLARSTRYFENQTEYELLYQEISKQVGYHKIRYCNGHLFSVGNYREIPILNIQSNDFVQNDVRLDMSIEHIDIEYSVEVEENCMFWCDTYTYDVDYTLKNNSSLPVTNFSIAAYHFPLNFSFSSPTLYAPFHDEETIMPNDTIHLKGVYQSSVRYLNFPFEILGTNFMLDANESNNFLETDALLNVFKPVVPQLNVEVFPIPCKDFISIEPEIPIHGLDIYNAAGVLMKSVRSQAQLSQLDIQFLPVGIYAMRLWDRNIEKFGIQKLVVER